MHRFGRVGRSVRTARAGEYIRSPTLPLSYTFAIELLLRDAKHIDAGLRFYRDPPRTDLSTLTRRNVAAVENWVPPEMRAAG